MRNTCFPPQQWLHERAAVLCYSYIVCLVKIIIIWDYRVLENTTVWFILFLDLMQI
jgi:hypothetical protein